MTGEVHDWAVEVDLPGAHGHASGPSRESLIGAPAADLIAYGRILAAEHPYGSQERELLTALAEALAARQPVEILAQMGRLQAKERTARERVEVLEKQLAHEQQRAEALAAPLMTREQWDMNETPVRITDPEQPALLRFPPVFTTASPALAEDHHSIGDHHAQTS